MTNEVQMREVSSNNIKEIGYQSPYLLVRFASGGLFTFKNVPRSVHEAMLDSKHPWAIFRDKVMGNFIGERIDYLYPASGVQVRQ